MGSSTAVLLCVRVQVAVASLAAAAAAVVLCLRDAPDAAQHPQPHGEAQLHAAAGAGGGRKPEVSSCLSPPVTG